MKAAKGGRRKRKEATPRSLAYEKTQRSHRLYLPKRDSRHAASRAVHRRRWPPSSTPSTSLRDTWAFGRGTQYAIHRDTHALTHARTQVCMTVRGRRGERERERERRRVRRGNRGKRFPHTTPPLSRFVPTLSTHSFSPSFSFAPFATNDARARVLTRQIHAYDLSVREYVRTLRKRDTRARTNVKTTWPARNFHRRERLVSSRFPRRSAASRRFAALPRNPPRLSRFLLYLFERRSCSRSRYDAQLRRRLLHWERDLRMVPARCRFLIRRAPRRGGSFRPRFSLAVTRSSLLTRTWHVGRRQWT